jgi:hypothetical protein
MEVDPTSPVSSQPYTILRIKRKRNEEPLDALGKCFSIIFLCPRELKNNSYRIQSATKETWRTRCLPVCRDGGTGGLGRPREGSPGALFGIFSLVLLHSFVLVQDRISALEREQALKVGTHQGHDDAPPPHLKRPDLSRQYTVVLDDKPATPSPASRPL